MRRSAVIMRARVSYLLECSKAQPASLTDLARAITLDCTFDFVAVSSYGKSTNSSGAIKLIKDLDHPIEGKIVVVVEDILDTGITLSYLCRWLRQRSPRELVVATCIDKPSRRLEPIDAKYVCFTIDNHFVIGYGMDFAEGIATCRISA